MTAAAWPARRLELVDLAVDFTVEDATVSALRGVSLSVEPGQSVALVGETGSGKSVSAMAVLRLLPPNARVTRGDVRFGDRSLLGLPDDELRRLRGEQIAMVFQDPVASLDPSFTVGSQLTEVLRSHRRLHAGGARQEALRILEQVRMPHPGVVLGQYPSELSGGMCQRVLIAMAIACNPALLIADEPTTALDVTVQAGILQLLHEIQATNGSGLLLITHDLSIVSGLCELVYVMYAGRIVEVARTADLFSGPRHPYTQALIAAIPTGGRGRIPTVAGEPGAAVGWGCPFAARCPSVMDVCRTAFPAYFEVGEAHRAACFLYGSETS